MKVRLAVNADGSEQIAYNTSLFPVRTVNSTCPSLMITPRHVIGIVILSFYW
jgi:hypothetical protein